MHNANDETPPQTRPAPKRVEEERATLVDILRFAIMQKLCVTARYNNMTMLLAPHMLWTKHGDLHVDAVTVERDGGEPKVTKVGTFKLAGLAQMALTARLFAQHPDFDPADPKYSESRIAQIAA